MKTPLLCVIFTMTLFFFNAQNTPQAFNWQGVITDNAGEPIANTTIGIQFQLNEGSATGTTVYTQEQSLTTNAKGLVSAVIGNPSNATEFSAVNWGANNYYLEVAVDTSGGTNYVSLGASQLLSVPYAIYAGNVSMASSQNEILDADGDTKIQVEENTDDDIIRFDVSGTEVIRIDKNANENTRIIIPGRNVFLGNDNAQNNTGDNNIFIGQRAGRDHTSGIRNILIGTGAGRTLTTQQNNVMIGSVAGNNYNGSSNVFIGESSGALSTSASGDRNTMIGFGSGLNSSGSGNIFIGHFAGANGGQTVVDNKLYIDNTSTNDPLIYGDFGIGLLRTNGRSEIIRNGTGNSFFPLIVQNNANPADARANGIRIIAGQNNENANSRFMSFVTPDGDEIATIRQNGNNSVNFDNNSDIRLKTNIKPTQYGLDEVLNIEVKDYDFKSELGRTRTGFIAQQLYEHYPEAVSVGGEDPSKNAWGVDYGKLTPILVKAIQEQHLEIEQLKAENKALKTQNISFESRLKKLEETVELMSATTRE